jgi:serine protease DegQ
MGLSPKTQGVLLSGILEGGPADRAGAKPGDVLTAVDGQQIKDVRELLSRVSELKPGSEAILSTQRKDKALELQVQIGKRPKPKAIN